MFKASTTAPTRLALARHGMAVDDGGGGTDMA
jgi:hypothetical protein